MRLSMMLMIAVIFLAHSDVLFSDDFNDGNADGWFENPGVTYEVIEGEYCFWGGTESSIAHSFSGDVNGYMSVPDYSFLASVNIEAGILIGQMVRFSYTSDNMYVLCFGSEFFGLVLARVDQNNFYLLDIYPMVLDYSQDYWMRFEVEGDVLGGKIWSGTPDDEPLEWMVYATDGFVSNPGSIALVCRASGEDFLVPIACKFDDVVVTDELSLELCSRSWAAIKSSF